MVTTKIITIERKQNDWSEDSPVMDTRILKEFIENNPNSKIISVLHSGAGHLLIVYEE